MVTETRKAQWRAARARARAAAREAGRCIACLQTPVRRGRVTCANCGRRANMAKLRRRERLASSAVEQARAFGIDLTQLMRNLRLTPEQRFVAAERNLRLARDLKDFRASRKR